MPRASKPDHFCGTNSLEPVQDRLAIRFRAVQNHLQTSLRCLLEIIGAVGVIGPTRLNYGRIVPIVNYTAQRVGRMIADRS